MFVRRNCRGMPAVVCATSEWYGEPAVKYACLSWRIPLETALHDKHTGMAAPAQELVDACGGHDTAFEASEKRKQSFHSTWQPATMATGLATLPIACMRQCNTFMLQCMTLRSSDSGMAFAMHCTAVLFHIFVNALK